MKRKNMWRLLIGIMVFSAVLACAGIAVCDEGVGAKNEAYVKVQDYVTSKPGPKEILCAEGEFVAVFNDDVAGWVRSHLDMPLMRSITEKLTPSLTIALNARGFAPAAARALKGAKDTTNYDAIWMRDNVWVYYSLAADPARRDAARKLLLALWDYYSSDAQIARFRAIITEPTRSLDQMAMPHIRFDGSSPTLDDVIAGGKPEVWNHRQIDAHGLFFTALGEAFENGLVTASDLTATRFRVLALYPLFLERVRFYDYEDAGAWEELPRKNASSTGLATRSIQVWHALIYGKTTATGMQLRAKFKPLVAAEDVDVKRSWSDAGLTKLADTGLAAVRRRLALGGESPEYDPSDPHFRLADAALLFLIVPSPLQGLTESEMRHILQIVDTLKRPMGILRYENDSYQSGNYWIRPPEDEKEKPALTGDTSSQDAFLWRRSKLIPNSEAQWFFDSIAALARMKLARITHDPMLKKQDLYFAAVHLKRALGQITGESISADGNEILPWQAPESINTVVINGERHYLSSPIVPLNWAKAALKMALTEYDKALATP